MEYKFKKGDKVRIKPGMDLTRLSIDEKSVAGKQLMSSGLTIEDDLPGMEVWMDGEYDNTPTYSVSGDWRIPEAFLQEAEAKP